MLTSDQTSPVISFPHSPPSLFSLSLLCSFIALLMKQWSVSGLPAGSLPPYLHTALHLPGESHLRCLATWSALCYCREKHSRAILTRPQSYSPLSSPSPAPLSVLHLEHLWTRGWKIKVDFSLWFKLDGKADDIELLRGALQIESQQSTSNCITLVWLWFTAVEVNWVRKTHKSVCTDHQSADETSDRFDCSKNRAAAEEVHSSSAHKTWNNTDF